MKSVSTNFTLFLLSSFLFCDAQAGKITPEMIEERKLAVISIKTRETTVAYGVPQTSVGTGFIADKEKGIVITNRHIASVNNLSTYEATFYNGRIADLKLIWNDPINDFAFLQVEPNKIPSNVPALTYSREAKIGQDVFMIGNNEANGHSVQSGTVNDLFNFIVTSGPQQVLSISLNSKGGSSGSPVFNDDGQVIGLNFASSDTTASSVPISYVQDALNDICINKIPERFFVGAIFNTINLDLAQDYYQYKNQNMQEHLDAIPGARNRILTIDSLLPTPEQSLEVGDIIEKINEKIVGPDHYLVEKELNQSKGKPVKFTICRNGDRIALDVPTYNLNQALCTEILVFGNTVFSTVNPLMSFQTGMPMGRVCIASKNSGSLFDNLPCVFVNSEALSLALVEKINGKQMNTLSDVIKVLPIITKIQKFNYVIKDYGFTYLDGACQTRQCLLSLFTQYRPEQYSPPSLIKFDFENHDWVRKQILD